MNNKSFPEFCNYQTGSHVESLKNYNLPDFILKLVSKECNSDLSERGKIEKKLQSMNQDAIELLYKIFVKCDNDDSNRCAQYRFYAYISSMYHKCEILINEIIPGASGKNHIIPVAVKENAMYIAIAQSKAHGYPLNKKDTTKFYNIVDDIKKGDHGTMLADAIYCSTVGIKGEALVELEKLSKSRTNESETKINFKVANFENSIYSLIKPQSSLD